MTMRCNARLHERLRVLLSRTKSSPIKVYTVYYEIMDTHLRVLSGEGAREGVIISRRDALEFSRPTPSTSTPTT